MQCDNDNDPLSLLGGLEETFTEVSWPYSINIIDKFVALDVASDNIVMLNPIIKTMVSNSTTRTDLQEVDRLVRHLYIRACAVINNSPYDAAFLYLVSLRVLSFSSIEMIEFIIQWALEHCTAISNRVFLNICCSYSKAGYVHVIGKFLSQHRRRQFDYSMVLNRIIAECLYIPNIDELANYIIEYYIGAYYGQLNGICIFDDTVFDNLTSTLEIFAERLIRRSWFLQAYLILDYILDRDTEGKSHNSKLNIERYYIARSSIQRYHTVFEDDTFLKIISYDHDVLIQSFIAAASMGNREFLRDFFTWLNSNNTLGLQRRLQNVGYYYAITLVSEDIFNYHVMLSRYIVINMDALLPWFVGIIKRNALTEGACLFAHYTFVEPQRTTLKSICKEIFEGIEGDTLYDCLRNKLLETNKYSCEKGSTIDYHF